MKNIKACCGELPVVKECTYTPIIDGPSHVRYFCKCLVCGREITSGNSWQNNKAEKIGYISRESAMEAWNMFIGFMERK